MYKNRKPSLNDTDCKRTDNNNKLEVKNVLLFVYPSCSFSHFLSDVIMTILQLSTPGLKIVRKIICRFHEPRIIYIIVFYS